MNTEPPKLSREEQRGRGALLQDICKGTKLRKVTQINDRSAPILESESPGGSRPHAGCCCAHLVPSSSSLEERIIPGLTSLPPSFQSPRAAAAAATALAQPPSSPRAASSKAAFPSSDLWEPRTAQVMATGPWSAWGSLGRALSRKGLRISLCFPGGFSCSDAGPQSHPKHGTGQLRPP